MSGDLKDVKPGDILIESGFGDHLERLVLVESISPSGQIKDKKTGRRFTQQGRRLGGDA